MLKIRIMPTLLFKDVGLVKGIGFDSWRRVGSAVQAVKVYTMREVDELVFFDITATPDRRRPDFDQIEDLASECFMPMTVGGGVRSVEDIGNLLSVGADKVAINTAAVESPNLIRDGAQRFGVQCIVVGIDARSTGSGWANIRIVGKVVKAANQILAGRDLHQAIQSRVVPSIVLFSAIHYRGIPDGPDFQFALNVANPDWTHFGLDKNAEPTEQQRREDRWRLFMQELGVHSCDEFEKVLVEFLESGLFDAEQVQAIIDRFIAETHALQIRQECWRRPKIEPGGVRPKTWTG